MNIQENMLTLLSKLKFLKLIFECFLLQMFLFFYFRCDFCKNGSYNQEPFYKLELNIKGCKNIYDCLNEFFKVKG